MQNLESANVLSFLCDYIDNRSNKRQEVNVNTVVTDSEIVSKVDNLQQPTTVEEKLTFSQLITPDRILDIKQSILHSISSIWRSDIKYSKKKVGCKLLVKELVYKSNKGLVLEVFSKKVNKKLLIPITEFLRLGIIENTNIDVPVFSPTKPRVRKMGIVVNNPKLEINREEVLKEFSFELTYMSKYLFQNTKDEDILELNETINASIIEKLSEEENLYKQFLPKSSGWSFLPKSSGWSVEVDCGSLEIGTGKQSNYVELRGEISEMQRKLEKFTVIPSSLVDIDIEGGCHINFNLLTLSKISRKFTSYFLQQFRNFMLQYPSVIWIFLSPNDNRSSCIVYKNSLNKYVKGEFFTVRSFGTNLNDLSDSTRLEMRFFMMPRSIEELDLHYNFARRILNHVFDLSLKNWNSNISLTESGFRKISLKSYTLEKSKLEVEEFCKVIDFPFNDIVKSGKFKLLKTRFSYGKEYLV